MFGWQLGNTRVITLQHLLHVNDFILYYCYSYIIIQKCWKKTPDDRPTFDKLSSQFNTKLQALNTCGESTTTDEGKLWWEVIS